VKLKRLAIFVVLLSLLLSVITGCQSQFQPGTYTDDLGRAVDIDEIPQRVISFGPSITETLFALGLEEKIVGVDSYSDYPEAAKQKPKVGDAFNPSLENIVQLEPDLVLAVKQVQLRTELDNLRIASIFLDPKDIDGIFEDMELVGKVTGTKREARKLITDMQQDMSRVVSQVENASPKRVFFIVDATDLNEPWTAGPGSFIDALITMAGGENVAAEAEGAWATFSMEKIVNSDPEIIIIQTMTGGIPTVSEEELRKHPVWQQITAVKQDRIRFIDGDIVSRPGPRIIQGLEEMATIIHPELFE
jgi:iron complex transport system substrate-binding protein